MPKQLDVHLFTQLVEMGPQKQPRVDALAKEAFERVAAGEDVNALASNTIKLGLKSWGKPPKATQKGHSHPNPIPAKSKIEKPADPARWGGY